MSENVDENKGKVNCEPEEEKGLVRPDDCEEGGDLPLPVEIIEQAMKDSDVPPQVREQITTRISAVMASGRMPNPITKHFNSKHVDVVLDMIKEDDANAFYLQKTGRWFVVFFVVFGVFVASAAVVYLLPRDRALLMDIGKFLLGVIGGIGIDRMIPSKDR